MMTRQSEAHQLEVAAARGRADGLALGLATCLNNDLESARELVRVLSRRAPHGVGPSTVDTCERLVLVLARAAAASRAFDRGLDLKRYVAHAVDLSRVLNLHGARDIDIACNLADNLSRYELLVHELMAAREHVSQLAGQRQQPQSSVTISALATRAAVAAARLLPLAARARYAEEYRCELYDLAQVSRRAQWAYSFRLLACALPMRRELRRDACEVARG